MSKRSIEFLWVADVGDDDLAQRMRSAVVNLIGRRSLQQDVRDISIGQLGRNGSANVAGSACEQNPRRRLI